MATISLNKLKCDDDFKFYLKDKRIELTTSGYPILHLHRMYFLNIPKGYVIDHINRNKFDFRRSNLRMVHENINKQNQSRKGKSGYDGVSFAKNRKNKRNTTANYMARIIKEGASLHLGWYTKPEEAAYAIDIFSLIFDKGRKETNLPKKKIH